MEGRLITQRPWVCLVVAGVSAGVFLGAMFMLPRPAIAGILGDTVEIQYLFPDMTTSGGHSTTGIVTAGGVTLNLFDHQHVTVFPDSVQMISVLNIPFPFGFIAASFNGVSVQDLTNPSAFTGFSIDPATTVAGFTLSDVSIAGGSLFINYQGLTTPFGSLAQVDFTNSSVVPEPSSMMLLGTGLIGAAGLTSRRWLKRRSG